MKVHSEASQDFDRAITKGFWRRVVKRLKRETNELLPFNEVRERFPLRGQHYLGLTTPFCPLAPMILGEARESVRMAFEGYDVEVEYDLERPWNPDLMNQDIRNNLGL